MKITLTIIFLVLIYMAIKMIRAGLYIQQRVCRIDPFRSESLADLAGRKSKVFLDKVHETRAAQAAIYTCLGAAMLTGMIMTPPMQAASAETEETDTEVIDLNEVLAPVQKVVVETQQKVTEEQEKEPEPESAWAEIPLCETISPSKAYMDDLKITDKSSDQYAMFKAWAYGEVITEEIGFQYIMGMDPDTGEDMKFYTVALSTYYQNHIGQKFRITMESGFTFGVIVGDEKANRDTNPGNKSEYLTENPPEIEGVSLGDPNHCVAGSNDMLEFIIDDAQMQQYYPGKNGYANNGSMNRNFDEEHQFAGVVKKIEVLKES